MDQDTTAGGHHRGEFDSEHHDASANPAASRPDDGSLSHVIDEVLADPRIARGLRIGGTFLKWYFVFFAILFCATLGFIVWGFTQVLSGPTP